MRIKTQKPIPKEPERYFVCADCGCEFYAESREYTLGVYKNERRYVSICPKCHGKSYSLAMQTLLPNQVYEHSKLSKTGVI